MLKQDCVRAVGAMSGTSLDGVDAAEIVTDGHRIFEFGPSAYRPYTADERNALRAVLGRWHDDDQDGALTRAAQVIEGAHHEILAGFDRAELIGFHGQTLTHDPRGRGTHQLGDGAALATRLGKTVAWDFRTNDVELGGEGAPLAPFFHFALARYLGADQPFAILNLGGVGNITWINPNLPHPESEGALLAFDTGPANAPINDLVRARLGEDFDADGALAAAGKADQDVLKVFENHPFFYRMPPKSLDRDAFKDLFRAIEGLSVEDGAATLTKACAIGVRRAVEACPSRPIRLLVAGGGRHNATLMALLAAELAVPVAPIEEAGFNGDMLEAQAFAFLAVRVAKGLPTSCPGTTGVMAAVGGGMLSSPD